MCGHDYSHRLVSNTVCLHFALGFLYWVLLLQCHYLEMSVWRTHTHTFSKWNLRWYICALFFQFQVCFGTYQVFYSESDFALHCWKLCPSYNFLRYSCIFHWDLLRTGLLLMIVHDHIYLSIFQSSWVALVKSCNSEVLGTIFPNKQQRCCIVYFSLQLQVSGPVKYPWSLLTHLMTLDLAKLFDIFQVTKL